VGFTPDDPILALRSGAIYRATATRLIDKLFAAMRRGEVSPHSFEDFRKFNRQLAAAEQLRPADWSQGSATLGLYRPMATRARSSVVSVLNKGVPVALGTVVGAESVVTKATVLPAHPACHLPDGRIVPAQVVGADKAYDLALLRVPTGDLRPIVWAADFDPRVGTFLAAIGAQKQPLAIGVVSVPRRDLPDPKRPSYGLPLRLPADRPEILGTHQEDEDVDYTVGRASSLAWSAGVRPGDLLHRVGGRSIKSDEDLVDIVKERLSGDVVTAELERDGKKVEIALPLRPAPAIASVDQSHRADDFPTVIECDVPFFSFECGGPVVDRTGRAVGVSIARVADHGGMIIPGDCAQRLLPDLQAGKLAPNWTPDEPPND
jgi:S1-C subfamily serine protease